MPTETIVDLAAVLGAFAFFAIVLTYADMTWAKPRQRRHGATE